MLELRGGSAGTSQLAFSRGLSSGANSDKRSYVDLGNKDVQEAAVHYLDACFVNAVMLQPNCRTTGLPSYFNSQVNHDTWHENHKKVFPHIKFWCKVAIRQNDLRLLYLREQPVGTWVNQIPPWTTLAKSNGTCK
eukprot:1079668-Pyramimonas_sp.AAC.1